MDLAHCTTLLIYLTLGEHLQILGERQGGMCKNGICNTKPAISLKRTGLSSQSYYRVSCMSCLSVTLEYCDQTVGWIKLKLGTQIGVGPDYIVLDGTQLSLP